jgi:hypothetical protein
LRRLPARWRISAVGLVLLAGFAALHACALPAYEFFTRIPDGVAKPHPFVDLRAILQGGACWRAGVNVYTPSACLDGGVFNYSPLLLRAALLPIGPWDTLAGGVLFCLAYMAALARLPPPAGHREFWLRLAASFSPAAYYALEQGNLDVAIFAAVVAVLGLPGRYGVFALAPAPSPGAASRPPSRRPEPAPSPWHRGTATGAASPARAAGLCGQNWRGTACRRG